ncbi:hypothetical protein M0R45_010947 [Rubus argutus]|uniref:Uncharacterized protein n=1 Tax=Rubus argutus TaxID=59490 RepID=A0AAW1YA74_RUBAR
MSRSTSPFDGLQFGSQTAGSSIFGGTSSTPPALGQSSFTFGSSQQVGGDLSSSFGDQSTNHPWNPTSPISFYQTSSSLFSTSSTCASNTNMFTCFTGFDFGTSSSSPSTSSSTAASKFLTTLSSSFSFSSSNGPTPSFSSFTDFSFGTSSTAATKVFMTSSSSSSASSH